MRLPPALIALLMLGASIAVAQEGASDTMRSPPCLAARAELEALQAQPHPSRELLERARRRTAQACLGASDGERRRSGAADPPQVVAPTVVIPPRQVQPPQLVPVPPPLPVPRPTAITTCDPAGCWDSEGRRLNQMGPMLVGPGGVCSGLGGAVACP